MTRKHFFWTVAAPVASLFVYLAVVVAVPDAWRLWIVSEVGPVELATPALFLAAGVVAARVAWRAAATSLLYRALFALVAAIAAFIALEELSYGQHLLGWSSPEWFSEYNERRETNLHNLFGSTLSHRMRTVANVGFPAFLVVLPLVLLRRGVDYRPGSFAWAFLPKTEFVSLGLVAAFCTIPQKVAYWLWPAGHHHWMGLGELKELYWSIGAMGLMLVLYRRHVPGRAASPSRSPTTAETPAVPRRRATAWSQ